jgi:hypothetical protein
MRFLLADNYLFLQFTFKLQMNMNWRLSQKVLWKSMIFFFAVRYLIVSSWMQEVLGRFFNWNLKCSWLVPLVFYGDCCSEIIGKLKWQWENNWVPSPLPESHIYEFSYISSQSQKLDPSPHFTKFHCILISEFPPRPRHSEPQTYN